jgi:hypothetical protein
MSLALSERIKSIQKFPLAYFVNVFETGTSHRLSEIDWWRSDRAGHHDAPRAHGHYRLRSRSSESVVGAVGVAVVIVTVLLSRLVLTMGIVRTFNGIWICGVVSEVRFKPSTKLVKRKCMTNSRADNGV